MIKITVYYSVQNGGDGSAYPKFMESEALARFDQDHMDDGWGEPCIGSISFESESPIRCLNDVVTKESYFIERYRDGDGSDGDASFEKQLLAAFFPEGLPAFTVKTEEVPTSKNYLYNLVFVDERQVAKIFRRVSESGDAFEKLLNSRRGS